MNPTTFVIQAVILTLFSLNASSVCPTGRNQFIDCANPRSYIQEYIGLDCPQFKLRDGLEAQWTFIRNRNIGLRHQLRPYFNNDESTADEFSEAVKSLIELHQTTERYLISTSQTEAAQQMLTAFAKQSCEWLNAVGIVTANCNDSANYLPLLEVIYHRLDLHDKILSSRRVADALFNVNTNKINYCAWINDRVLNDCSQPQDYNQTVRDTVSTICNGYCFGQRPRGNMDSPIELCRI